LATPQQYSNRHSVSNWSWVGERSTPRRRNRSTSPEPTARFAARPVRRSKLAKIQAPVPVRRALRARHAVRVAYQPIERGRHLRYRHAPPVRSRCGSVQRCGAHCDEARISCQFRGLEDLRGADRDARMNDQNQRGGALKVSAAPRPSPQPRRRGRTAERPPSDRPRRRVQAGPVRIPQAIQRQEHRGGIRTAATQAAAGRNMFNDMQVGAELVPVWRCSTRAARPRRESFSGSTRPCLGCVR